MRCTKGISIFVLLFLAAACDRGSSSDDAPGSGGDASLKVVATIGMLADMASELGGDCVEVEGLMGPGVDPHLYRASAGDLETLSSAQQILYGGMLLEGAMGDVLERMAQRTPTLAALETVDEENLLSLPDSAGHFDPHLWMDVGLWAQILPPVEEALTAQRSDCAEAIRLFGAARRARQLGTRLGGHDSRGAAGAGDRPRRLCLLRAGLRARGARDSGRQHGVRSERRRHSRDGRLHRGASDPRHLRRVLGLAPGHRGSAPGGALTRFRGRRRRRCGARRRRPGGAWRRRRWNC